MRSSFRYCLVASSLLLVALFSSYPVQADTYKITVVDTTQDENFLGVDDHGDFVVNDSNNAFNCGESSPNPCF